MIVNTPTRLLRSLPVLLALLAGATAATSSSSGSTTAAAAITATVSPTPVQCSEPLSVEVGAGGALFGVFTIPATGVAKVTFSTCDTGIDTVLTIGGIKYDDDRDNSNSCGNSASNERVVIEVGNRSPGKTILIKARFYSASQTGILQLGIECDTLAPTVSPSTTAPTVVGASFSPTVTPTFSPPVDSCGYGKQACGPRQYCCTERGLQTIPSSIMFAHDTVAVDLHGNELRVIEPTTFANLSSLIQLSLYSNKLTMVNPTTFNNLGALNTLRLDSNEITVFDPTTFAMLGALTFLNLGSNKLTVVDPATFANLSALTELHLDTNKLSVVDPATFANLIALTSLWLYSNNLMVDPAAFVNLGALNDLRLSANELTAVESKIFGNLSALTRLDLDNNELAVVDPATFANLRALQTLNLWSNKLTRLDPTIFDNLKTLTYLTLHTNYLTAVDPATFTNLRALQILDLSENNLTEVDPATFENLGTLTVLNLNQNKLTVVDPTIFSDLAGIGTIGLSSNELNVVHPKTFFSLGALYRLTLHSNKLTVVDPATFENLGALTYLRLDSNKLTVVDPATFENLSALNYLRLDSNKLTVVDPATFSSLGALTYLDLHSNKLTMVDRATFSNLGALTTLDLSSNEIPTLQNGTFAALTYLYSLNLAGNRIQTVDEGVFDFAAMYTGLVGRYQTVQRFLYNPNPLQCGDSSTDGSTSNTAWGGVALFHCTRCTQGYVESNTSAGADVACVRPDFQLDDRSTSNSSAQRTLAVLQTGLGDCSAYIGEELDVYRQAAAEDRTFEPKRDKFRGYSPANSSFAAIRFEVKVGDIDIGCGAVVVGGLHGPLSEASRISQTYTKVDHNAGRSYASRLLCTGRQRLLHFEVLVGGSFDFSSCGSRFPASLAVYNASCNGTGGSLVDCIVAPYAEGQDQQYPQEQDANDLQGNHQRPPLHLPERYSCPIGSSANLSDIHLPPGAYLLGVQPLPDTPTPASPNDVFEVEMRCRNGDTTAAPLDPTDGGVTVNPVTGQLSVSPGKGSINGTYSLTLTAIDSAGVRAELLTHTLRLEHRQNLTLTNDCGAATNRTLGRTIRNVNGATRRHDINSTVVLPALTDDLRKSDSLHNCTASDTFKHYQSDQDGMPRISYDVVVTDADGTSTDLGQDTFVNGRTGRLSFTLNPELGAGNYSVKLRASTGDSSFRLVLQNWTMDVRPNDTATPGNGPNSRTCGKHGHPIDAAPQDDAYTCQCDSMFEGENCESPIASEAAATIIGAVLGSIAAVLLIGLAVVRYQLHVAKNRPADVGAMQTELLQRLGLALPTDIGPHEFGITLTFEDGDGDDQMLDLGDGEGDGEGEMYEGDLELQPMLATTTFNAAFNVGAPSGDAILPSASQPTTAATATSETDDMTPSLQFQQDLAAALTEIVPSLAPSMQQVRLSKLITHTPGRTDILVVLPKRPQRKPSDQAVVAALSAAASKRQLVVGSHVVSAACLAMPRQLPREIGRKGVLRIELLGEGVTAEVHKYQLSEPHRGTPPFLVAAKTAKAAEDGGATRTELLEEAAILALLDHRNILPLVGVVTVPRDMPALVLLMYCERGTLKDHVTTAGVGGINTVTLLTYCAEVLQGLHYVSLRRIVHRDIAARNVLLDANDVCKLADFGRARALADIGKEYVKLSEELPIRHAAVEVLVSGKFSTASDIWSFGCLVWEVLSAGANPYHDIASFTEVSSFVRMGNRMAAPLGQPVELHQRLMMPCWAASPADRPGILDVYTTVVSLGAIPDDLARNEMQLTAVCETPALGSQNTLLRGPSIHHLTTVVRPAVLQAVLESMTGGRTPMPGFEGLQVPADGDIWHMVQSFIKPSSAGTVCPRDHQMGSAYVDILSRKDDAGKATALLSYAWGYKFAEVIAALETWTTSGGLPPKQTYFWVCSFCLNQHGVNGLPRGGSSPAELARGFYDRIVGIGQIVPMLQPWDNPGYVRRAWCLFELYTAVTKRLKIDIILSASETERFRQAIRTRGYGVVDAVLDGIDGALATATHPEELALVRKEVLGHTGGMPMLNETVKLKLREWFQSQGGIRTARRQISSAVSSGSSASFRPAVSSQFSPVPFRAHDSNSVDYDKIPRPPHTLSHLFSRQ